MTSSTVHAFDSKEAWATWLATHYADTKGVKLRIAKKGAPTPTVTYAEAVAVALAWGWIDGKKEPLDASAWVQTFSPRTKKSSWSKINRDKALALMAAGAMHPPGLAEVERAKSDGRWEAAYDSPTTQTVPLDLTAALEKNRKAAAFFATIDRANRYAVLYRVQTAKKAETRAARIATFVEMLARGETLHPARGRAPRS